MLIVLSGCAAGDKPAARDFPGPWGAEIAAMFNESTSDFVRGVLEDGTISDQEYAEMRDRYGSCLAESGISFDEFAPDGSAEVTFPPNVTPGSAHEAMGECSKSSGEYPIGALFAWMQRNPEHRDEDAIMAECLVLKGAVAAGYTAKDYALDTSSGSWPLLDESGGRDALEACIDDPLGLFGGR